MEYYAVLGSDKDVHIAASPNLNNIQLNERKEERFKCTTKQHTC